MEIFAAHKVLLLVKLAKHSDLLALLVLLVFESKSSLHRVVSPFNVFLNCVGNLLRLVLLLVLDSN